MNSLDAMRESEVAWRDSALDVRVVIGQDGIARLRLVPLEANRAAAHSSSPAPVAELSPGSRDGEYDSAGLPLVDLMVSGWGRDWAGRRYSESAVGGRMRYVAHESDEQGLWSLLAFTLEDPLTGLVATVRYRRLNDVGVIRGSVSLANAGDEPLTIESISSLLLGDVAGPGGDLRDVEILWAENDWQAESRWQSRRFRDALPQLSTRVEDGRSRGRFALTSMGSWSSGTYLPMGAAVNRRTGHTLLWQIEHNGAWHWQLGEHLGHGPTLSYLSMLGPTDVDHHWRVRLAPGESCESVPVALAVAADGLESAAAKLTRYRRAIRRDHEDHRALPVVFNDYLNTVKADPTTERLLPLIAAAAAVGAEYFCIDAGWYAEPGEDWWDAVGEWIPSEARFTRGLRAVIEQIRAEGMVPGLWIEPEAVGVRSPVADRLPAEAFLMRDGQRVVEQARYHLDLRHPAAREHLDRVIDFLVGELGLGYMKMDYNINVAPGTDVGQVAAGVGLLGHNRALLAWIDAVLDRHPGLTLEACSSGAMRCDYATLAHFQLQSTSDQEDPLSYPPIAAAAALAIAPEQAGIWASVQPDMSDDLIAFTLCSALLGRIHLSGNIDAMTSSQLALVAEALSMYKQIRHDIAEAVPFWPLGLPKWKDSWIAAGLRSPRRTYVIVWRRHEAPDARSQATVLLPLPCHDADAPPRVLYPSDGAHVEVDAVNGELLVSLPRSPSACLIAVGAARPDE